MHHQPVDLGSIQRKYEAAQKEVASSVGVLDFAQSRLESYVEERIAEERERHEEQLTRVMATLKAKQAETDSRTESSPSNSLARVETVNPDWTMLNNEIRKLKSQQRLLASPADVATNSGLGSPQESILKLRNQLAQTPKTVTSNLLAIDNPFVQSGAGGASEAGDFLSGTTSSEAPEDSGNPLDAGPPSATISPDEEDELSQLPRFDPVLLRQEIEKEVDYQRLLTKLDAAQTAHQTALDQLAAATNPSDVISESVAVVQPPRVVRREVGEVTARQVGWLLIPAALIGFVCAWLREPANPPSQFISPEDVEDWLRFAGHRRDYDAGRTSDPGVNTCGTSARRAWSAPHGGNHGLPGHDYRHRLRGHHFWFWQVIITGPVHRLLVCRRSFAAVVRLVCGWSQLNKKSRKTSPCMNPGFDSRNVPL